MHFERMMDTFLAKTREHLFVSCWYAADANHLQCGEALRPAHSASPFNQPSAT